MSILIMIGVAATALIALLVGLTELFRQPTELEQLSVSPTSLEVEILLGCSLFGVTRLQAGGYRQQRYLPRDLFLRAVREGHNPRDVQTSLVNYAKKCGSWKSRRWVERQIEQAWELTEVPKDFPSEAELDREPSGEIREQRRHDQVLPAPPLLEDDQVLAAPPFLEDDQDTADQDKQEAPAKKDEQAIRAKEDEQETPARKDETDRSAADAKCETGVDHQTSEGDTAASTETSGQSENDTKEHLLIDDVAEFDPAEQAKPKPKPAPKRQASQANRKKSTKSKKPRAATSKSTGTSS
jgi:hypothetical protein